MREIKFKGWHTTLNKMFSAEEMAKDQLTLLTTGNFINVSGSKTTESIIYSSDKFIPLQYTGLKDKNHQEIYEGDILNFQYPISSVYEDEDYFITLKVVIDFHGAAFWFTGGGYTDCNWHFYNSEDREVVGNIYQNPELLKQIKP